MSMTPPTQCPRLQAIATPVDERVWIRRGLGQCHWLGLAAIVCLASGCHPFEDPLDHPLQWVQDDLALPDTGVDDVAAADIDLADQIGPDGVVTPDTTMTDVDDPDPIDPALIEALLCSGCGPEWWDASWQERIPLVVALNTLEPLEDFPFLVEITDPELGGSAKNDGGDIRFVDETGQILSHEIEAYDPQRGRLVAWVLVPLIRPNVASRIDIYYGNPLPPDPRPSYSVWEKYAGVWHFPLEGPLDDSSPQGNHGIGDPDRAPGHLDGKIERVATFDGTSQRVTVPYDPSFLANRDRLTLSLWFLAHSFSPNSALLVGKDSTYGSTNNDFFVRYDGSVQGSVFSAGAGRTANHWSPEAEVEGWHHAAVVYDGSEVILYFDGRRVAATPHVGSIRDSDQHPIHFGAWGGDFDPSRALHGSLDEIRVAPTVRSAAWIRMSYLNQNAPTDAIVVGQNEMTP